MAEFINVPSFTVIMPKCDAEMDMIRRVYEKLIKSYRDSCRHEGSKLKKCTQFLVICLFCNIKEVVGKRNIIMPSYDGEWILIDTTKLKKLSHVPTPLDAHHGTKEHKKELKEIYTYKEFVEIEKGDVVVDVGAYVGAFSLLASNKASKVLAIDPGAVINSSLQRNVKDYDNIKVSKRACWKNNQKMSLNISLSQNDNSLLDVDDEAFDIGRSIIVEANTLEKIALNNDLKVINFLKVEAEGVEPEVLEGALGGSIEVEKISINCGAERDGREPTEDVLNILKSHNYKCRVNRTDIWNAPIVFGRKMNT